MSVLQQSDLEHFQTFGWVRVPGAFSAAAAAAMCDVIWDSLAETGVSRDDPSTWTKTRPENLQHLKSNSVFRAIGSPRTLGAIEQVLAGQALPLPKDWGAFFLHFPTDGEWNIHSSGWHMDGDYTGELSPPCGILIHAMLTDVQPRCGGTNIISGSHRLVHRWFTQHPPAAGTRSAQLRKSLQGHAYLRDLCTAGAPAQRIDRFHDRVEVVDGIPLQVVENTVAAGDVILMHTLLLHAVPAAHAGNQPRFLLSTGIQQPYW
jgi:ectoine hydroxylase-related dioxygenase (phytanoyl-CoA dioxygenase family)